MTPNEYKDMPEQRPAKMGKAKPPVANDRQVGGEHYKTGGLEHWDMFGPEYLMGCATKYVSRWRKKNGVQDLEKAKHYAEKMVELVRNGARNPLSNGGFVNLGIAPWVKNAGLDWVETTIVMRLMTWQTKSEIEEGIAGIDHLIETSKFASGGLVVGPTMEEAALLTTLTMTPSVRRVPRQVRPDADESRHASLFPWQMTREAYLRLPQERRSLLDHFYTQRGDYRMVLDVYVENQTALPRELQACYTYVTNTGSLPGYWRILVGRVPEELRDEYPTLDRELNRVEWEQLPIWQRGLYHFGDDGKHQLTSPEWGKQD